MIFKIIALIIGIALGLCSILFFSFIFFFIIEYIFYILLAAILIIFIYEMLKKITNTIKKKNLEHRNKSFEKIVDEIYYIYNNSNKFNSKIYKLGNEYYLTFYNDIFSETNKINSWDIIIDYSQSYNSKENAIFYININKLKNNKNIKQYYQDDLIAMNFGYNYKTNISKFIDEK